MGSDQNRAMQSATGMFLTMARCRAVFCVRRFDVIALAALFLWASPTPVLAGCRVARMAEFPVTMRGSEPYISAKINGEDALFIADSGAYYSMITAAAAARYKLRLSPAPRGLYVKGVGGKVEPSIATVKVFTIAGIPVKNVEFLVGGSTFSGDSEGAGLLGHGPNHPTTRRSWTLNGRLRCRRTPSVLRSSTESRFV
jgi:Aspartyl protease